MSMRAIYLRHVDMSSVACKSCMLSALSFLSLLIAK